VEKLLKEHRENQDLVRSIGGSHYQIVFPVQLRHREKMGISTREIGATKVYFLFFSFARNSRKHLDLKKRKKNKQTTLSNPSILNFNCIIIIILAVCSSIYNRYFLNVGIRVQ
jgi:hypothetical protein